MIVIASTRPGRGGWPVAQWFISRAGEHGGFDVEVVDLVEFKLPLLDEPNHPRLRQYVNPHTQQWSEKVDASDAFVFVTPEYNHGYPASLKNAIDFLHHEWRYKPVGFVSYGGVAAGTRSVEQLQQVVTAVKLYPLIEQVNIPFYQQFIDDGVLRANDVMEQAAGALLDQLVTMEAVLRPLRESVAQTG
ncbi:MAG TPA: NAD(P)H-dependent oxidoreductase [Solirubrobacteraceae bacterium]|nr:NAD(P)H-dependent oxidoreductase [Solirubrobacteraceae bacterium]